MFRTYKDKCFGMAVVKNDNKCQELYMLRCKSCSVEYDSETDLDRHRRSAHKDEFDATMHSRNSCKICVTQFPDIDSLIKHTKCEHLLSSENADKVEHEIFICDECDEIYFNKGYLEMHILRLHTRKRYMKCQFCLKMVKCDYWHHFIRHGLCSPATCPICLKKTRNRQDLKVHLKMHAKNYSCESCSYVCSNYENYKHHFRKHIDDILTDCTTSHRKLFIPKKNFKGTYKYRQMSGVYLFNTMKICILCRKICTDKTEMIAHVNLHAPKWKSEGLYCSCGEKFFNKVLLKQHVFKSGCPIDMGSG